MKNSTLILFILLSSIIKAQTITIPIPIAKNIAKELIGCDSAKAILILTEQQLQITEQKVILKDSIISNYVQKEHIYKERIKNEQSKFEIQQELLTSLKKQNRQLKFRSILGNSVLGLGLTVGFIYAIVK